MVRDLNKLLEGNCHFLSHGYKGDAAAGGRGLTAVYPETNKVNILIKMGSV